MLALCADAKVTSGRTRLSSEESERFIDKFSFSRRELGKISGKFTAVGGERYSDGHRHQLQLALGQGEDWLRAADAISQLGRICRPDDVARAIVFLLGGAHSTGAGMELHPEHIPGMLGAGIGKAE